MSLLTAAAATAAAAAHKIESLLKEFPVETSDGLSEETSKLFEIVTKVLRNADERYSKRVNNEIGEKTATLLLAVTYTNRRDNSNTHT